LPFGCLCCLGTDLLHGSSAESFNSPSPSGGVSTGLQCLQEVQTCKCDCCFTHFRFAACGTWNVASRALSFHFLQVCGSSSLELSANHVEYWEHLISKISTKN
jgi:hypothetical protein